MSMKHISEFLPSEDGRPSERQIEKVNRLIDIGQDPNNHDLGFMARMLVLATLPHSDPGDGVTHFSRTNGGFKLSIQAAPDEKLPSGSYPRLILAWMCREAVTTKERTLVLGDSLSDFMRQLGLMITGGRWGTVTRLREQMRRMLSSRITVQDYQENRDRGSSMEVATNWDLWWDPKEPEQAALWKSTIRLGERLYHEMIEHPVPFDMRVLKEIKQSALAIDLYLVLTYRMSYMKKPTDISWKQLHDQFGADYTGKYGYDNFRKECLKHLKHIKQAWPALTYSTPRGRLRLFPTDPHVPKLNNDS